MTTTRTFARSAAVIGAATALTLAGAGAAMATTHDSKVDGNTVSVTFELEGNFLDSDACGAVLVQTTEAVSVAAQLAEATNNNNLLGILKALNNNESVTVLKTDGILIDSAVALLSVTNRAETVYATDVPSNVYALVSVCVSDTANPTINPFVMVGNPVDAVVGSVQSASTGDSLGAASSLLQSGNGTEGNLSASLLGGGSGE